MTTKKIVKLTPSLLKRIIEEEAAKFGAEEPVEKRAKETEEVDADELADSLDKHIDYMKALKIEEGRLSKRLNVIRSELSKGAKKLLSK